MFSTRGQRVLQVPLGRAGGQRSPAVVFRLTLEAPSRLGAPRGVPAAGLVRAPPGASERAAAAPRVARVQERRRQTEALKASLSLDVEYLPVYGSGCGVQPEVRRPPPPGPRSRTCIVRCGMPSLTSDGARTPSTRDSPVVAPAGALQRHRAPAVPPRARNSNASRQRRRRPRRRGSNGRHIQQQENALWQERLVGLGATPCCRRARITLTDLRQHRPHEWQLANRAMNSPPPRARELRAPAARARTWPRRRRTRRDGLAQGRRRWPCAAARDKIICAGLGAGAARAAAFKRASAPAAACHSRGLAPRGRRRELRRIEDIKEVGSLINTASCDGPPPATTASSWMATAGGVGIVPASAPLPSHADISIPTANTVRPPAPPRRRRRPCSSFTRARPSCPLLRRQRLSMPPPPRLARAAGCGRTRLNRCSLGQPPRANKARRRAAAACANTARTPYGRQVLPRGRADWPQLLPPPPPLTPSCSPATWRPCPRRKTGAVTAHRRLNHSMPIGSNRPRPRSCSAILEARDTRGDARAARRRSLGTGSPSAISGVVERVVGRRRLQLRQRRRRAAVAAFVAGRGRRSCGGGDGTVLGRRPLPLLHSLCQSRRG